AAAHADAGSATALPVQPQLGDRPGETRARALCPGYPGIVNAVALVVPGNALPARDGAHRISRACRRLVREAESIARRERPAVVVFTGWSPEGGPSEAAQMRELWRGPDVELVLEETASTTVENASRTLPLLLARDIDEAIVVCTPLHLGR